MYKKR